MAISAFLSILILGLAVRMALRLTYGARGPQPGDGLYLGLNILSWVLLLAVLAPLGLLLVGGLFGGAVALLFTVLAISMGVQAVYSARGIVRRAHMRILSLAAERGQPIGGNLLQLASLGEGRIHRAAERLGEDLENGIPPAAAMRRNRAAVPREAVAYLSVAVAAGEPTAAFAAMETDERTEQGWNLLIERVAYLVAVVLVMVGVLSFIMISIVPSFKDMFSEFGLELPAMTSALVAVCDGAAVVLTILGLPILVGTIALIVIALCYAFGKPVLQPITDRVFRARHRAVVLRALALAAEREAPFDVALDRLAEAYPARSTGRRIRKAADDVAAGAPWTETLWHRRLIRRADRVVLESAQKAGNLPWAMRTTAGRIERRMQNKWFAFVQIAFPCCVLTLGAAVAFVVIALFVPLVDLVVGMAGG